jgi:crossover junction endodeoxyribonuclease RusA
MMRNHKFFVVGKPETQGSMRGFVVNNRAILTSTNKRLKSWRFNVAETALANGWGHELIDGPVRLDLDFRVRRPLAHYGKAGLKANAPKHPHTHVGDLDKLIRAIGDALTDVVWTDDRRIVDILACKSYAEHKASEGVYIIITELE